MPIVQEIDFKTKNDLIAKANIEKTNQNGAFITSVPLISPTAEECFRKLLCNVEKIISAQFSEDSLETIDNTCNCPFLSKVQEEEEVCSSSIKVLVNGQ